MPDMLCKSIVGFSPECLCGILNLATASETRKAYGIAESFGHAARFLNARRAIRLSRSLRVSA